MGQWGTPRASRQAGGPSGAPQPARDRQRHALCGALWCAVVRGGHQWRAMPPELPPWQTTFYYFRIWFRIWRNDGTWETIHSAMREQARTRMGREGTPRAALLDSQAVKVKPRQRGACAATTRTRS
jgi:transposase